MLGTSEAWSTSQLSRGPSDPAYYIKDCGILLQHLLYSSNKIGKTQNEHLAKI